MRYAKRLGTPSGGTIDRNGEAGDVMDSAILSTPLLCAGDFVSDPTSSLPSGRYVVVLEIVNLPEHQGVFPLIVYELGGWPSSRGLFLWMEGGLGTLIFSSAHRSWHALVIYMKRVDISR